MLKSNSISADSTFYILSYFVFFKITYDFLMNISFEYVLLVVVRVYGYFFHSRWFNCIRIVIDTCSIYISYNCLCLKTRD